ncbi:MAG: alpha/beta hydrolase, partial [Deltaproteobacteria bacterium]|nr:alpha/beta hydrolase [Deltaproteobacteria bacterium]
MTDSGCKIFIHGLESSNKGTKSVFFREKFPHMIIPTFVGTLPERLSTLDSFLSEKSDIRIVGSSFGGLMGALFAMENESRVKKLILLAPAIHIIRDAPVNPRKISIPITLYHGTEDQVIPLEDVEDVAGKFFTNLTFHKVQDDH